MISGGVGGWGVGRWGTGARQLCAVWVWRCPFDDAKAPLQLLSFSFHFLFSLDSAFFQDSDKKCKVFRPALTMDNDKTVDKESPHRSDVLLSFFIIIAIIIIISRCMSEYGLQFIVF